MDSHPKEKALQLHACGALSNLACRHAGMSTPTCYAAPVGCPTGLSGSGSNSSDQDNKVLKTSWLQQCNVHRREDLQVTKQYVRNPQLLKI